MPRYYFNVSNGDWQRDRKGLHLSGPDQARALRRKTWRIR
jgi:hypothetical protein